MHDLDPGALHHRVPVAMITGDDATAQEAQPFLPATLQITFLTAEMAEMATWVRDVERVDARTIAATSEDPLSLSRRFTTIVALTRSIVEP